MRQCGLFNSTQRILPVGDGDLSFALSLARAFGTGRRITATTFNSMAEFEACYPNGRANAKELMRLGAAVFHSVDATHLRGSMMGPVGFADIDAIVFNFPQPGWCDARGTWPGVANIAHHIIQRMYVNHRTLS